MQVRFDMPIPTIGPNRIEVVTNKLKVKHRWSKSNEKI